MRLRSNRLPHLLLGREPVIEGMLAGKPAFLGDEVGGLGNHAVPLAKVPPTRCDKWLSGMYNL